MEQVKKKRMGKEAMETVNTDIFLKSFALKESGKIEQILVEAERAHC